MKLQAASKKEISRIAVGTLVCDVIMVAGLFLLSQFGIGKFALPRILLGAACGSVVAILNFTILCLTVQRMVKFRIATTEPHAAPSRMRRMSNLPMPN